MLIIRYATTMYQFIDFPGPHPDEAPWYNPPTETKPTYQTNSAAGLLKARHLTLNIRASHRQSKRPIDQRGNCETYRTSSFVGFNHRSGL
ncbi:MULTISPECIES: hypothetical protein [Burkholderia]|uniref:hypothetical protein n=1 Tax=Burkholderia TaxID=32008 RepID=UPI00139F2BDD|nr:MULTISPECIES: hypothetical protein [Burkholderia]